MSSKSSKKKGTLGRSLRGIGPIQIEQIALAIDGLTVGPAGDIVRIRGWLKLHPEDDASRRQLAYWQHYISTCRHIAALLRQAAPRARLGKDD